MKNRFKRVLLKLSGEYLGGSAGSGFDFDTIKVLTEQLFEVHQLGVQIGIVLGGGNFFRGAGTVPISMDRVTGDKIGMLATTMNSLCLGEALKEKKLPVEIMTGLNIPAVGNPFDNRKAENFLQQGDILIFAGGTGCPYFSTDTAAVLRALEIKADIVIKGTKVDGVYDKDPVLHQDAIKYDTLDYTTILENDLKVMDATAIAMCRDNKLPLSVLNIGNRDDLLNLIKGQNVGTLVDDCHYL
jgi:uridylate kinase